MFNIRKPIDGVDKFSLDLSSSLVPVYSELPPFAIDLDTGKLLNPSRDPVKTQTGYVDIQEEIDSYRDDCDIYQILKKVIASGDSSLLNRRVGTFADLANLPDNLNDLHLYVNNVGNGVDSEVLKIALSDAMTSPQVLAAINDYVTKKTAGNLEVKDNE